MFFSKNVYLSEHIIDLIIYLLFLRSKPETRKSVEVLVHVHVVIDFSLFVRCQIDYSWWKNKPDTYISFSLSITLVIFYNISKSTSTILYHSLSLFPSCLMLCLFSFIQRKNKFPLIISHLGIIKSIYSSNNRWDKYIYIYYKNSSISPSFHINLNPVLPSNLYWE